MLNEDQNRGLSPILAGPIGVIGLGLIGGSIAKAIKRRAGVPVIGLDIDPQVVQAALDDKVLDQGAALAGIPDEKGLFSPEASRLLAACRVVFICTPAALVADMAAQVAQICPGLVTDVASVKKPIMDAVRTPRFIGGHPMAGSEKQGYAHSSETLLENAVYVLCLQPGSDLPISLVQEFEELIRKIGATPWHLDAAEHDRAVATVSHLPHVAAAALSLLAAQTDHGSLARLAAGGFRDITRIASSDAALWAGISLESAHELLPVLDQYLALITDFRTALASGDFKAMQRFFFQAAQYRNTLPVDGRGALSAHSSLTVYVTDHPGVLGHITTLLGEQGINISNIRIRELRTYEGGCLQLVLPDSSQAAKAAWLLKEAGYECD